MFRYYFWVLFLVLNPFYWFPAGKPQVGDYMIFVIALFSTSVISLGWKASPFNKTALISFIGYTFLANGAMYLAYLGRYQGIPLLSSIFYVYNVIIMFFAIGLATKNVKRFVNFTQWGIFLSVTIQVGYFLMFGSANFDLLRPSFFFKTPNQLGYYALLMLTTYVLLNKVKQSNLIMLLAVFLSCLLMTLLSASKAAIGGAAFLLILYIFDIKLSKGYSILAIIAILGISLNFILKNERGIEKAAYVMQRVDDGSKDKDITEWEYRGYDRMNNHPEYLLLGSGEGMYARFDTYITKHEMHSSIGNLIFSYGIPGFVLFAMFFASLFKKLHYRITLYIIPVVLYSLTHMGLRFTPMYILFAIFPIIRLLQKHLKKEKLKKKAQLTA